MTHPILVTGAADRVDGVGFTVVALAGPKASVVFMQAFGVIYLLTGVIGFLTTGFGGNVRKSISRLNTKTIWPS